MVNLIYGLPGTGKTTLISNKIAEDVASNKKILLIVPEQQTVEVERKMLKLLPASAQLHFEVLNFSRLANKLFRIYGGLSYNYITTGMKNLFMKRTLVELAQAGMLNVYQLSALGDSALPSLMLSQINEFKINSVNPSELEHAAKELGDNHKLNGKLLDFVKIYKSFDGMVKNAYDDSSNDLEKLSKILEKNNFFNGYNVYIDGFSSYTACEHKIIKRIFAQADNCFVTIPAADERCLGIHMSSVKKTSNKLRDDAKDATGNTPEISALSTPHRAKAPEAKRILNSLWDFSLDVQKLDPIPNSKYISVYECADPYREAEAAANTVLSLLQQGYRRNEIAVIAGNMDSYKGIIDSAFEKAGIPYFMSENTELVSEPLISLILSAFSIKQKNWRQSDVIAYLKTGLTDISQNDIDIFELYISTWKINGSRFFDEFWSMNPNGYTAEMSQRGIKILETANRVKNQLVAPLAEFFTALDSATNVAELCDATYEFFKAMGLSEKLAARAKQAHLSGNRKAALECAGTHKAFIKVLSDISASMGDTEMTIEEFSASLKLVLNNTDIGTIPTAADEVILGSASMLRASDIKCAILMGMCEGEFPGQVSESGFFSDSEKKELEKYHVTLSSDTESRNSEELLYAYRAMTLPSDKLFILYHASASGEACNPSIAVKRVLALLPNVVTQYYDAQNETDRIMSKKLSFESLSTLSPDIREVLYSLIENDPEYADILKQLETPVSDPECDITPELAEKIFGKEISLSQSSLEKFIKCKFLYYCQDILSLRENKAATFSYVDSGNFIHKILENFLKATVKDNKFDRSLSPDDVRKSVLDMTKEQIDELFKDKLPPSKRLLHHFKRLEKLAILIADDLYKELCQSSFNPQFFEMGIGTKKDPILPAYEIKLKDNTKVLLNGKVDRVDIFKDKDAVYIKVVDYKTGSKKFSIEDIENGLNIQMLLYLFAICNSNSDTFKKDIGCESNENPKPASVMYISTNIPTLKVASGTSQEEIFSTASESISREGLILNDPNIIKALNNEENPKYILNATADEDGKYAGNSLATADDFTALEKLVEKTISDIAEEMKKGHASAVPLITGQSSPCNYCSMKQLCRADAASTQSTDSKQQDTQEDK